METRQASAVVQVIQRVFVYGTLNPEHPNYNEWFVEDIFHGPPDFYRCTTKGTRLPSRMPWDLVWFHDDGHDIAGVCLLLDDPERQIRTLDGYEGYREGGKDNLFIRKEITLDDGNKAWGYEWGKSKGGYVK